MSERERMAKLRGHKMKANAFLALFINGGKSWSRWQCWPPTSSSSFLLRTNEDMEVGWPTLKPAGGDLGHIKTDFICDNYPPLFN